MATATCLEDLEGEAFCYLTTAGRKSGKSHTIEIWFGLRDRTLYMLSGGGDRSDWVRNLIASPEVNVRISDHSFVGNARTVTDPDEDALARELLVNKYQPGYGGDLTGWRERALPIAVDLHRT